MTSVTSTRRIRIRRSVASFSAVGLIVLAATTATGGAQTGTPVSGAFTNGTASAQSQSYKVNPTASALSIGVTFGTSLAGYTNQVAKAESRGIDLGIIGTTLAGKGCDGGDPTLPYDKQPHPLTADSRDPASNGGKSSVETFNGYDIPFITKRVLATPVPKGEAVTITGGGGQAGAVEMGSATSSALTRVIDGKIREAAARSDITDISLGGGVVRLGGLHWEATHHTGTESTVKGAFSITSMTIGGVPIPIPPQDLTPAFALANTALAPFGLVLSPPATRIQGTTVHVDPLKIGVVPSTQRDAISGALLGAAYPVRQAVTDALLAASCKTATYITIADIGLGSMTGAGSFSLEFGGASAGTGDVRTSSLLGGTGSQLPKLPSLPDLPPLPSSPLTSLDDSAARDLPVAAPPAAAAPNPEVAAPVVSTKDVGSRGGKLAAVAGAVLALALLLAEADRRKMRQAQRMIPEV